MIEPEYGAVIEAIPENISHPNGYDFKNINSAINESKDFMPCVSKCAM